MGRRNLSATIPQRQRSCLPANRELRMALRESRTKPFGIRRQLSDISQEALMQPYQEIYDDGWIPDKIETRDNLHVTLLPMKRLSRQLTRGIVLGYEFGKAMAATKKEMQQCYQPDLVATLGEVAVLKNKFVVMKVESEQLEDEVEMTNILLGRFGLKGAMRERMPLHITLGESHDPIARVNQKQVRKVLEEVMPVGEAVVLSDPEFYAKDNKVQPLDSLVA